MIAGDEIVTLVEIDQPLCQLQYGFTPCQAQLGVTGTRKCHNTRATCQDAGAYSPLPLPLRFSRPQDELLPYGPLIPILANVDTSPASVNLAAMDKSASGFGQREKVTLKMDDVLHSDLLVDKYRLERITGEAAALESWMDYFPLNGETTPRFGKFSSRTALATARAGNTATRVNASGFIEIVNANLPRIDYDPVTLQCKGQLIEAVKTNRLLRSSEFDNAAWTKTSVTVAANTVDTLAPDGLNTAEMLTTTSTGSCFISQAITGAVIGDKVPYSIYAKKGTTDKIIFEFHATNWSDGGNGPTFDLTTGTRSSGVATDLIVPAGNGWYRCSGFRTAAVNNPNNAVFIDGYGSAVVGRTLYVWGAQAEDSGTKATSLIPTTAAAATRNADVPGFASIAGWFNATEGTLVAEFQTNPSAIAINQYVAEFENSGNTCARILIYRDIDTPKMFVQDAACAIQVQSSINGASANGAVCRVAFSFKANDFAASRDGSAVVTDVAGTIPTVDRLRLGANNNTTESLDGWLRRITYYPRALADADVFAIGGSSEAPEAVVPFLGTYDPYTSGTFWGKWLARNPYHSGYAVRIYEGVIGEPVDYMRVRQYIIDRIDGPSDGQVTITCKDLFSKVEARKALAPLQSSGELKFDLTNVAGTLTLNPAGIGDALNALGAPEYPTAGNICIGTECITYTRTPGSDVLTLTTRGALNTKADQHHVQDLVQLVLSFVSAPPHQIARDLLTNFVGMVDGVDFDYSDWTAKAAEIIDLYTARVVEPTAVSDLIGEIEQLAGFTLWPDVTDDKIKFTALRAATPNETVDDVSWIKDGTLQLSKLDSARVSEVWVHYGQINPTVSMTDRKNYYSTLVEDDQAAESPTQYDGITVREVFSRWIPQFGRDAATRTAQRLLAMFRDAPLQAEFMIYADKAGRLSYSDYFNLLVDEVQDEFGQPTPVAMAPLTIENGEDFVAIKGQEVKFPAAAPPGATETFVYIENDAFNLSMRSIYDSLFASPTGSEVVTFVIEAGVRVGSTSTGAPALQTGLWPVGVNLKLLNHGRVAGMGGAAGVGGGFYEGPAGSVGSAGGPALQVDYTLHVDNTDGQIWGGGGGGGGGALGHLSGTNLYQGGGGGGGGAGVNSGAGAAPGTNMNFNPVFPPNPQPGSTGGPDAGGAGGAGNAFGSPPDFSGNGGNGGGPGLAGSAGTNAGGPNTIAQAGSAGGAAGNYIVGNSLVIWIANGDRRGGVS